MVKIGVIGAGGNGAGHARYYHECPRSEVVAIADPDGERASALAAQCEAEAVSDYRDFLDGVDAVVISSPNHLHRDHAVECARAGCHIYCEKPMGLDAEQADQMASAVAAAGVRSVVGFSVRFGDTVHTMQQMVQEGRTGDLISIWTRRLFFMDMTEHPGWRADHALSGGVLLEVDSHELDWMMAIAGEVESVYARTYAEGQEGLLANDHVWVTMNFASGAVGTLEGSQISPVPRYQRGLLGTRGAMETEEWGRKLMFAQRGGRKAEEVALQQPFDLRGHLLDCIEQGVPCVSDAEWGRKVMNVADAIFRSAATGEVQVLRA